MKKKRLMKLLMAKGTDRNTARFLVEMWVREGYSHKKTYDCIG